MKSVLISIQPYYVFLIIARLMGWNIPQDKTVEVRKDFPKDSAWNKVTHIYCSKSKKSFNKIPKEYQPLMAKMLGKVVGGFVCDKVEPLYIPVSNSATPPDKESVEKAICLSLGELKEYAADKMFLFGWHVSDLKTYDKPKELGEFTKPCPFPSEDCTDCPHMDWDYDTESDEEDSFCNNRITRPPQSWMYIEEISNYGI